MKGSHREGVLQSRAGPGVFQELAGLLVCLGIHFHKEDLGNLLRHRKPPYIPIPFFTVCGFGSVSFSSTKCVLSSSSSSQQVRNLPYFIFFLFLISPASLSFSESSIFYFIRQNKKMLHAATSQNDCVLKRHDLKQDYSSDCSSLNPSGFFTFVGDI